MKRKPNKPRPEAQTHTEPGNGAAEPGGSAFGAGSEQEPGAAGTSGQSVPKMGNPAKSDDFVGRGGATERADFGGNAAKGAKAKFATTKFRQKSQQEQAAASKLRMEKRGENGRPPGKSWQSRSRPNKKARSVRRREPPDGAFTALCMASSTRWSRKMWEPKGPTARSLPGRLSCGMAPGL